MRANGFGLGNLAYTYIFAGISVSGHLLLY